MFLVGIVECETLTQASRQPAGGSPSVDQTLRKGIGVGRHKGQAIVEGRANRCRL